MVWRRIKRRQISKAILPFPFCQLRSRKHEVVIMSVALFMYAYALAGLCGDLHYLAAYALDIEQLA